MSYLFRSTIPDDLTLLREWGVHPSVHKWIYIDDWEEYYNAVSDINGYYLYSVYDDSQMVAHIAAENEEDIVSLSIIVDPCYQNNGIGTAVIKEMIANTKSLFGDIKAYTAHIFNGNTASIKCFTNCGFKLSHIADEVEMIYKYDV